MVYQDFNANGVFDTAVGTAVDHGMAGVTVTAYDANNAVVNSALSNALGNYSLNVPATGAYRVEFTGLPTGTYFGPQGTSNGSAIQFVSSGNSINVNLAIVRPEDISPNNPTIVTSAYVVGGANANDLNPGATVVTSFQYTSGAPDSDPVRANHQDPMTHALNVQQQTVGTTWGLAYDQNTNKLYASAFMKRTTGYGPGGPGAIYQMGTSGAAASVFVDLNSLFPDSPAGNLAALYTDSNGNAVPFRQNITDPTYWFRDGLVRFTDNTGVVRDLGWDAVGKTALGGLALNADGTQMFTVALGDRRLYTVPTSGVLKAGDIGRFNLPLPASVTGVSATNPLGDLRPFAVEVYRGIVYIGAVNSAESTQNASDLKAYVFAFDPVTKQFINRNRQATTTEAVLTIDLNYSRGKIHVGNDPTVNNPTGVTPPDPAMWNPWSPVYKDVQENPAALGRSGYPQPMLTGLSFDADGNLNLGIRDRSGDQFGRNVPIDPNDLNNFSYFSITAGDTLRAFINTPRNLDAVQANPSVTLAGWTLETNGRSPDGTTGAGPVSNGQGPGGAEFYWEDDFPRDPNNPPVGVLDENDEVSMGAVLQLPGFNQSAATSFDPVRQVGAINGGGIRWYNNSTGEVFRTYELYVTPTNTNTSTFAKGNGLGDLIAVTGTAPIEIGNYAWNDANRNGVQDAGESAFSGLKIDLYAAGTNGSFGDSDDVLLASVTTDANGNYIFSSGTGTSSNSHSYGLGLLANHDYQIRVDRTQTSMSGKAFTLTTADATTNGMQRDSNVNVDGIATVHTTLSGRADHSVDIGVAKPVSLALGDFVWNDVNNDGRKGASEPGVDNVTVNLYLAGGTSPIQTMKTSSGGQYLFTGLAAGTYVVEIVPPTGFTSSTGTNAGKLGLFEPGVTTFENNADHGTNQPSGAIRSGLIVLGEAGNAATNPNDYNGVANAANLSIDFGLIRPLSIGNLVWSDLNNDGIRQDSEPGLGNVTVNLRNSVGGLVTSTTTNSSGGYLFTNLTPDLYRVEIDSTSLPIGFVSSTGGQFLKTGPFEPAPGTTVDSTDYGSTVSGVVHGPLVDLQYNTQPLGEAVTAGGIDDFAADENSNRRQDFGFFQPLSLGNLIWYDVNNDGKRQSSELGAGGVTARLLDASGNVLRTTTTTSDGGYLFDYLLPGTFRVEIVPPKDYISSSGLLKSETGPYEPAALTTIDNEDKGTTYKGGTIRSGNVVLGLPGSSGNPSLGGLGNLTIDFGVTSPPPIVVPPPPPPPATLPASVSGYVYRDTKNTNGLRELAIGEIGIPGVTIRLVGNTIEGPVALTTSTNGLGFYNFPNLPPGTYVITETQPIGFYDGLDTPGSLGGTTPSNDVLNVTLGEDQHGVEYNFGELLGASVFGNVYEDINRNRRLDVGEPGIPGVIVTISGTAFTGTPMVRPLTAADSLGGLVAITDANGHWEFPLLPPGTYTIVETQPAAYKDFFESVQEPKILPVNVGNDVFNTVILAESDHRGPLNYGEVRDVIDNSKRNFLGSSQSGTTVPPTTSPPISVTPDDVSLNPAYSVNTGKFTEPAFVVVAASAGRSPLVRVFDYSTGVERFRFYAYEASYTGGVRVAQGDVNGDGIPDIITATGQGGGPRVRVFDGSTGLIIRDFFAYESNFRGGVFVAAADVNGDGKADIITGTEQGGGPRVTVFDAVTNDRIQDFFAFDSNQRGGVRVSAADFNGDGKADIVTTAGAGTQTRVKIFDGASHTIISDFVPYDAKFTGGVYITAGDVTGDGVPDVVTSADVGGGPHVQIFNGLTGQSVKSFFAENSNYRGGVRVGLTDVNGDGIKEIITGTGIDSPAHIRIWNPLTLTEIEDFYAYETTTTTGVYVG